MTLSPEVSRALGALVTEANRRALQRGRSMFHPAAPWDELGDFVSDLGTERSAEDEDHFVLDAIQRRPDMIALMRQVAGGRLLASLGIAQ
ncbi:MAG: hypothetical protein QM658_04005 [Gordonia sp. (in: high G+C Gram-positive bacteria)]